MERARRRGAGAAPRDAAHRSTGGALTRARRALEALRAVGPELGLATDAITASFEGLVAPCAWPTRPLDAPALASGLAHGAAYGFSVVLGMPRPELRALVEAQAERDDPRAYWAVGERMTAWIGAQPGADVERYRAVADGFVPDREAPFRVWHGVEWSGERTAYRVYLSCRAGPEPRARLVRALDALGARPAFERCERALRQPAEPTILSLDLGPPGRVKVYLLHAAASWDELRPLVELGGADVEDAARFVARASGGRPARWLTASTIDGDEVTRVALHFGLLRRGRPVEQAPIATLVRDVARDLGLDAGPYELLRRNAGPHHFISFQAWNGAPRLTTYFGPAA